MTEPSQRKFKLPPHTHEKAQKIAIWLAVFAFAASAAWNVATRLSLQSDTTDSIGSNVDAIEKYCKSQRRLTKQYKIRGENEIVLAEVQLLTTQAFLTALEESPPPPDTTQAELDIRASFIEKYEETIPKLEHILKTVHILPLTNCKRQASKLRAELPPP